MIFLVGWVKKDGIKNNWWGAALTVTNDDACSDIAKNWFTVTNVRRSDQ